MSRARQIIDANSRPRTIRDVKTFLDLLRQAGFNEAEASDNGVVSGVNRHDQSISFHPEQDGSWTAVVTGFKTDVDGGNASSAAEAVEMTKDYDMAWLRANDPHGDQWGEDDE